MVEILAPGKVKLMSVLFNHGMRYEICNRNPIQLVRQSAKRKSVPVILTANEVQRLLSVLGVRENALVLLAFGTGLRMSELFGLKWHDIDFQNNEISVTRSIVFQVVGPCKTEASATQVTGQPTIGCSPAQLRVAKNRIGGSASCEPLFVQQRLRSASHSTSDGTLSGTRILHC